MDYGKHQWDDDMLLSPIKEHVWSELQFENIERAFPFYFLSEVLHEHQATRWKFYFA